MRAKELMIGDWVNIYTLPNDNPKEKDLFAAKISTLQTGCPDEDTDFCEGIIPKDDGGYGVFTRPTDTVFPIPVTNKILEINGFERRGCMSSHKELHIVVHHFNVTEMYFNSVSDTSVPLMIPFTYVHELQHALRSCGFSDLADNFKLETKE